MNKIDLNGRCAVVTAARRGLGAAIAERFAAPAQGRDLGSRPAARGKTAKESARNRLSGDRAEGRRHDLAGSRRRATRR